jgi:hypothetical protein
LFGNKQNKANAQLVESNKTVEKLQDQITLYYEKQLASKQKDEVRFFFPNMDHLLIPCYA